MKSFERRGLDHYVRDDGELPLSLLRAWSSDNQQQSSLTLQRLYKEHIFPLQKEGHFSENSSPSRHRCNARVPEKDVATKSENTLKPKPSITTKASNKRKPVVSKPGRPSKKQNSRVELDEISVDEATRTTSTSASTAEPDMLAKVEQLFPKEPLYAIRRKGKKGTSAAELYFFESVKLSLCKENYDSSIRGRLSGKLTFHVGDVVAISTIAEVPPKRVKNPWMPFTLSWAAAQVLAIYRKENSPSSQVFVEFRYLYRLTDIDLLEDLHLSDNEKKGLLENKHAAKMLIEVDEFVSSIPVEKVLGNIEITSNPKPSLKWLNDFVDKTKSPQVPHICRHFYQSKIIATSLDDISDWTSFKGRVAGPLSRGLLCEKAHPGKDPGLQLRYLDAIKRRLGLSGDLESGLFSSNTKYSETGENEVSTRWPLELMNVEAFTDDTCRTIYKEIPTKGKYVDYLSSVLVPLVPRRNVSRTTANKGSFHTHSWKVKIGDFVCVAWDTANPPRSRETTNPWYPFVAPWRVGQVTCIYRETTKQSPGSNEPLVELCMFNRRCEMPSNTISWMPPTAGSVPEIFQTDVFERDVKASRILGTVDLFIANHVQKVPGRLNESALAVEFRCRYLFLHHFSQFQPLFTAEASPKSWFQSMTLKAIKLSPIIKERKELLCALQAPFLDNEACPRSSTKRLRRIGNEGVHTETRLCSQETTNLDRRFFFNCVLTPSWDRYALSDVLFPEADRKDRVWVGCVGDIVAVHSSNITTSSYFPYSVPWRAAQIVSIFQCLERGSSDFEKNCMVEIRWLLRRDITFSAQGSGLGVVYEYADGEKSQVEVVKCDALIGPINIFMTGITKLQQRERESLWSHVEMQSYLPVSINVYGGIYEARVEKHQSTSQRICTLLKRCLEASNQYDKTTIQKLFAEVTKAVNDSSKMHGIIQPHMMHLRSISYDDEKTTASESSSVRFVESNARLLGPAFYVDHGASCEFYQEACVRPRYGVFCPSLPAFSVPEDSVWKLRLGDVFIVRHGFGSGRTSFGTNIEQPNSSRNFPLADEIKWAVAELVAIIKRRSLADNMKYEIVFEIRWLYRASELKGIDTERDPTWNAVEEVLESDHYDEISPCNILAPVELVSTAKVSEAKYLFGMPVIQFHCRRFWSPRRRSLIPIGDLSGRIGRARIHSKYSKELNFLSTTSNENQMQSSSLLPSNTNGDWKESFRSVIKKLSLTDASIEGFERSTALIGRQSEQNIIKSFLRNSIIGQNQDNFRASYFVAGPPGVGKTSCIRAAIGDLKQDQKEGLISSFEFVSLNGMEMRNPNEAYTRFLEQICRDGKRHTAESARKQLAEYFEKANPESQEPRVIVLLLDEIDYLVTPREEVLYDFFNWPATSRNVGAPLNLVVIGISNTLDLLDRLHHRIQSRIGKNHLPFQSYDVTQTVAILSAKISQASPFYKVFQDDAVLFASKKTSMASGDIRKAFHICQTAAEIVLDREEKSTGNPVVMVKDVVAAVQKTTSSAEFKGIVQCAPFEALLLISLAVLRKNTGIKSKGFDLEEIITKMEHLAKSSGDEMYLPPPNLKETLGLVNRLSCSQLINVGTPERFTSISFRSVVTGCGGYWPLVYTEAEDTTLIQAFKNTPHAKLVNKYLVANSCR
ncbi:origin recognition complex subunit 1 [Fistulifera solaris]|uniref:Origin recognition complex subunit 1 n=1 Tax=Fistulifera solaris TaxID=1519565 RepID=A0A1Z5K0U1_FISSO|nr:origin recognition complex subunit 1 [Fistulifera solaris]|eukprot:GAX19621.1 origin recognition complex subunit 1 [Fistulifera solaris]